MSRKIPILQKEKAVTKRGFSRWIFPRMKNHKMGCCDCGLVHEYEYKIFVVASVSKSGNVRVIPVPSNLFVFKFRARRARNYTAAQRKKQ